ncbi:hypothetical protein PybrP1_011010 [[Pythium] brassicae (nom. inval.)]|nr:hypothetical protein PybrP1_011010 [[Pythium] brassicae (nom. inval.)]
MTRTAGSTDIGEHGRIRILAYLEAWTHPDGRLVRGTIGAASKQERVRVLPVEQRTSVHAAAAAVSVPYATLQRYISNDQPLRAVRVRVKPVLTYEHRLQRPRFALAFV